MKLPDITNIDGIISFKLCNNDLSKTLYLMITYTRFKQITFF